MKINWQTAKTYEDILYHKAGHCQNHDQPPSKRNAFRPKTVFELYDAFVDAREDTNIGVVLFTGAGPHRWQIRLLCRWRSKRSRNCWVCRRRWHPALERTGSTTPNSLHAQSRDCPRGWVCDRRGHVLVICDLTIAADNAILVKPVPKSAASTAVWCQLSLARCRSKGAEIWFLCREYTAAQALEMGGCVVPVDELEQEGIQWANEILDKVRSQFGV